MNDKTNMDNSIREKLEGFSVTPPPHLWDSIQGEMAAQKRKKRMAYIGWVSAAAVVVFAFLAGWFFNERSGQVMPVSVEQQSTQPVAKERTPETVPAETAVETAPAVDLAENTTRETDAKTYRSKPVEPVAATVNNTAATSFAASFERFSLELLEGIEAFFGTDDQPVRLAENRTRQQETPLAADEMKMAENIRNISETAEKETGWILGMNISPGYASHTASHTDSYAQNMTYSGESGNSNMGAGLSVQYKTGKKLRIESGIYYAQNGQRSNPNLNLFAFGPNADYAYSGAEMLDAGQQAFANAVDVSSSGIHMNSTAGIIKMKAAPQGAEVSARLESSKSDYSNTLYANGEFSQVFEFVEIPLYLRYSLVDKKIGVELLGGLSAGVVVGNNAYIDNQYGLQNIGSTEDISTLNVSGTVGVGVNYALGKHFSLAVEPRLNYYLNSINTNPDVEFRPYRMGVFTGLYYEF